MTTDPEPLPDRRRHGYAELEHKLDQHALRIEERIRRYLIGGLVAFAIIGLICAASLVGFGILLREQGSQADEIQRQRAESIQRECRNQNLRHENTIDQLNEQIAVILKTHPSRAQEIRRQVKYTIALIDALAPHQDCAKQVKTSVEAG